MWTWSSVGDPGVLLVDQLGMVWGLSAPWGSGVMDDGLKKLELIQCNTIQLAFSDTPEQN